MELIDRLMAKAIPEPNSGCWIWTAMTDRRGYGKIKLSAAEGHEYAHRTVYRLTRGDIGSFMVCHKCDNPSCINPDHLFLGTSSDNRRDCVAKGRNFIIDNRGERSAFSKLTDDSVREIRKKEHTASVYAARYGVDKSTIINAWNGKNWKHIQ